MSTNTSPPPRPRLRLRLRDVGLVTVGGAAGTLVRYAVSEAIPDAAGFPTAIAIINVAGAFLLGWLLSAIALKGPETPGRAKIRLLVGTGALGGFTTYGTFINDEDMLLGMAGMASTWILFGAPTIVLGVIAAWLGGCVGRLRLGMKPEGGAK
ncbi:CrcB protein [Microbacterium endophyticum]|uniref:Fluoride-specific ion channel FluC n=1 Tax=Microbacterium endophyticum TaxID=1526412 RepID=A0A7W4V2R2_9MICO|nr:CrcB family protein [Microbacterium endophyticum]MBB2975260.1 CrcB protein [Microbacterium endophyticum]NIK35721.1 CrcB protein [Microbacterium endophyticum]